jgi:hypothetical protein
MGIEDNSPILAPVAVLILWSMIVLAWAAIARMPAARKLGLSFDDGQRTSELAMKLPPEVQWKMDNYNHLMEQPTLFYAAALALALAGMGDGVGLWLAWAYVGVRIVHSLVHGTSNKVAVRFRIFAVGNVVLLAMGVYLALGVF